jgi:hypothetical protein
VVAPIVAVLGNRQGVALAQPERRDTAQKGSAVQSVLDSHPGAAVPPEQLLALLAD